jgi:hypothetical protein
MADLNSRLTDRQPQEGWPEMRGRGSFNTTAKVIDYLAANGHLMSYYEDAGRKGHPARQCAWEAWHSDNCRCGGQPIPDW